MSASIAAPVVVVDEFEDVDTRAMTDAEHLSTFGWAWDDPDRVEDVA